MKTAIFTAMRKTKPLFVTVAKSKDLCTISQQIWEIAADDGCTTACFTATFPLIATTAIQYLAEHQSVITFTECLFYDKKISRRIKDTLP